MPDSTPKALFRITGGKGFNMRFSNGYAISVQFGSYNYCSNEDMAFVYGNLVRMDQVQTQSPDAEIAIFRPGGGFLRIQSYDDVLGHQTTDQVAQWILRASIGDAAFPQELEWTAEEEVAQILRQDSYDGYYSKTQEDWVNKEFPDLIKNS